MLQLPLFNRTLWLKVLCNHNLLLLNTDLSPCQSSWLQHSEHVSHVSGLYSQQLATANKNKTLTETTKHTQQYMRNPDNDKGLQQSPGSATACLISYQCGHQSFVVQLTSCRSCSHARATFGLLPAVLI